MGLMGAAAGYGFTGQDYKQRLETYKVMMMMSGVAYEFAALGAQFSHANLQSIVDGAERYGHARLADGRAKEILSLMNKPQERTPIGGQGLAAILDRVDNGSERRIPVSVGQGATDEQLGGLANDLGALESIYRNAQTQEERELIKRLFQAQAQAVQQAATASSVEPIIQFLPPGDPRRRPEDAAPPTSTFQPGVAGQQALADQAQQGAAAQGGASVLGGVTLGPGGTVNVPLSALPRESVAGLFQQGAFRRQGTSSRGGRGRAGNPSGQPMLTAPHFSAQTSHGGHAHGPTYAGTDQERMRIGVARANEAMERRSLQAAMAQRGGRQR